MSVARGSTPFLATAEADLQGPAHTIALAGAGHYVQEELPAEMIAAAIRAWWPAEVEAEK